MMCQLNVYVVCNLATECKKDGSKKRSAYTLIIGINNTVYSCANSVK